MLLNKFFTKRKTGYELYSYFLCNVDKIVEFERNETPKQNYAQSTDVITTNKKNNKT